MNQILQKAIKTFSLRKGISKVHHWGGGGQSIVYYVKLLDGKSVCLKIVHKNKTLIHLERERRFLRLMNSKSSEYFPQLILDAVEEGFIFEEWIEGIAFKIENRYFLLQNLKTIVRDFACILEDLTSESPAVLHRDIKPNNLCFRDGKVIVLDFGSSEFENTRSLLKKKKSSKLGTSTHKFQPFEQLASQSGQDRRVDVFAAASIIFAILEGKTPYDNRQAGYKKALSYYKQKENELICTLKKWSPLLSEALFHALRVNPEERATNLWGLVNALEEEKLTCLEI